MTLSLWNRKSVSYTHLDVYKRQRQLNSEITAKRNVNFMAFALINAENVDFQNSMENQFKWLENQGFDVVEHKRVTQDLSLIHIYFPLYGN